MSDPADGFALQRFVNAQTPVWPDVVAELGAGRKRSHWMWFVFPQLRALGRSETALFYGIGSLAEAKAYSPIRCSASASPKRRSWRWQPRRPRFMLCSARQMT